MCDALYVGEDLLNYITDSDEDDEALVQSVGMKTARQSKRDKMAAGMHDTYVGENFLSYRGSGDSVETPL